MGNPGKRSFAKFRSLARLFKIKEIFLRFRMMACVETGDMKMGLLEILSKLGILRFGAKKGVYRSGTDRPTEFLMDDVFDAKRDLTTKEDVSGAIDALRGKDKDDAPEA